MLYFYFVENLFYSLCHPYQLNNNEQAMPQEEVEAFAKSYKTDWTKANIDFASILNYNNSSNISTETAYKLLDLDKNGVINADELHNRLKLLMYKGDNIYEDAENIISAVSKNDSHVITFGEFQAMCDRKQT